MNFKLSIIDAERPIYEGDARRLTIPALEGVMTVLAKHMSVVTPVGMGEVVAETPEKILHLTIGKGIFSMEKNHATLLIEDATYAEEISEAQAEEARLKAQEIIQKGIKGPDLETAMQAVRRSALDLKVARRRKMRV
ncbi:MAG: hypothetical protein QXY90_04705 [Candidatus Anstonellales archaeon]